MAEHIDVRAPLTLGQQASLINAFGQRDLKAKFNGTLLGWLWSLVVPLVTLGIYAVIFGGLFKMRPPALDNRTGGIGEFALWLFAGLTIWGYFQNSINAGINGLLSSGGLLQKVYFPAYAPVLGAGLAVGIQSAIEAGLLMVVLALLGFLDWSWLLVPVLLALIVVFVQAIAVILAIGNVYMRDLAQLVGVILQLMFYATPIIYVVTIVPESKWGIPLQFVVKHMPVAEYIELFRSLVYMGQVGSLTHWAACLAWAGLAYLGARIVARKWGADLGEMI
ncbi:ABC transporter permease [Actinomyces gaoshouyii]|uniref:Transport permease protein n=1 Tax=Actinomyces gaoshouyii TaxID=1960083 RepID=A0A8H9LED0_9ACTO|nr:ABC transporter permease [Actinomyces gaoshouyii]ARD42244.1 ABC transporter [Actinomyces gaoshouyii]GGO96109.1 transport permease protein [Actinomyces gaoshouyii]